MVSADYWDACRNPTPLPLAARIPSRIGLFVRPLFSDRSRFMSTTGWVVLGIVVVIVIWAISVYNSLVAMRQRTNQAFADIDVQLKQRHDLIPNLVETVKGYAAHERGTLEAVVQARNAAMAAPGRRTEGGGGKHAHRRIAAIVRIVGELSEPEGQREFPAAAKRPIRHREQARRLAPLLQQRGPGIQYRHPAVPGFAVRRHFRLLRSGPSSISAGTRAQLEQAPSVKF